MLVYIVFAAPENEATNDSTLFEEVSVKEEIPDFETMSQIEEAGTDPIGIDLEERNADFEGGSKYIVWIITLFGL